MAIPDSFVDQAIAEGDPGYDPYYAANGFKAQHNAPTYHGFLLLSSGLQMAGLRLTPQTFADGLHRTVFPNPDHKNMPGKVGFNDGDFTMTNDGAEWFYSTSARSPYQDSGGGSICYVASGARHRKGEWPRRQSLSAAEPTGNPFFTVPCDSGA